MASGASVNVKTVLLAAAGAVALLAAAVVGVPTSALKGGEALTYKSPGR
jgi:hypothetical protein